MLNKDEVKGKAEQVKGIVKEKAGQWTGDEDLEAEGIVDQATGKVREATGEAKRRVEETVADIKKAATRGSRTP
jgi:uncharacterized protein YjbJ (UPF0337 family)